MTLISGEHRALPSGAAVLPRRLYLLPQAGREVQPAAAARAIDAGRLQPRHPGGRPGEYCVRGGLIDLFPMGSALPYRIDLLDDEIESIRTFDVDTQRTRLQGEGGAPAAGARVSAGRSRPDALSRALSRNLRGRSVPDATSTRTSATASRPAESNTICRCSSSTPPPLSITCPSAPPSACTATSRRPSTRSGRTRSRAINCCAATARSRCCRRSTCSCRPRNSSSRENFRAHRHQRRRKKEARRRLAAWSRPRCRRSRSSAAPPTRSRG